MKKIEVSVLFGIAAMLLYFFLVPDRASAWWTAAFEPLCDGILSEEGAQETLIVRSKLLELLQQLF